MGRRTMALAAGVAVAVALTAVAGNGRIGKYARPRYLPGFARYAWSSAFGERPYDDVLERKAEEKGMQHYLPLFKAIMNRENRFRIPNLVLENNFGADHGLCGLSTIGLRQLEQLGKPVRNPLDSEQNIGGMIDFVDWIASAYERRNPEFSAMSRFEKFLLIAGTYHGGIFVETRGEFVDSAKAYVEGVEKFLRKQKCFEEIRGLKR